MEARGRNFSADFVERVKDSVDIVEVAQGFFPLQKKGARFVALCPFHREKSPSFSVNPNPGEQFFHCFGCQKSGDVLTLVMELDHLSFPEAVKVLARKGGVPLPDTPRDPDEDKRLRLFHLTQAAADFYVGCLRGGAGRRARTYLEDREMSGAVQAEFGIGFAPDGWRNLLDALVSKGFREEEILRVGLVRQKEDGRTPYDLLRNRVVIPIRDPRGRVIGFGGRTLGPDNDPHAPKYINSPETDLFSKRTVLFGFDRARDAASKEGAFLIMEGYMDVIAAHQRGLKHAVGVLGTALTRDHAQSMLRHAKRAVLLFDADEGGKRAADRGAPILLSEGLEVSVVSLPDGKDPDEFLRAHDVESFRALIRDRAEDLISFLSRRARERHSVDGVASGAAAVRDVLETVGQVRDAIRRDLFLSRVAQEFAVDERLVRREAGRMYGAANSHPDGPSETSGRAPRPRLRAFEIDEVFVLRGAVFQPALAKRAAEVLLESDFQDPVRRRIFLTMKVRVAAGDSAGLSEMQLALREDGAAYDALNAALGRNIPEGESAEAALSRILSRRTEVKYRKVRDEVRRAGGQGPPDRKTTTGPDGGQGAGSDTEDAELEQRLRQLQRFHKDRYSKSKDAQRPADSGGSL